MKEMIKNRLLFVLKYIIGLSLLGWIIWRFDFGQIIKSISGIHFITLVLVLMMTVLNLTIQFRRWRFLIGRHSADYSEKDLLPAFFAGFALRLMIPGGHAEITKIFMLPGKKSGKVVAFTLEKYFETYFKFMLILIALPLVFAEYKTVLWPLAVLGIVFYFFLPRLLSLSFFERFHEKDLNYRQIFFFTLLFSISIFISLIIQYYILLNDSAAIGIEQTALVVVFIWGAGLIPISISGLGVRENLAAYFLAFYGIAAETAVAAAFFIFVTNIILPALIGALFIYKKRKTLGTAGKEIKQVTKNIYQQYKNKKG